MIEYEIYTHHQVVVGAGGVATGGATEAVAAAAEVVALVSITGTTANLCLLGTL